MKKLLSVILVVLSSLSVAFAQSYSYIPAGLTYSESNYGFPPQGYFVCSLMEIGSSSTSRTYRMSLDLPDGISQAAYANIMVYSSDGLVYAGDRNDYGTSSVTFTVNTNGYNPNVSYHLMWAIDYDDGTWQLLEGDVSIYGLYSFSVPN